MTNAQKVGELEDKLHRAMEQADVTTLCELMHPALGFVIPTGEFVNRALDIENMESGRLRINEIRVVERELRVIQNNVVSIQCLELNGDYLNHPVEGQFRYLRVWQESQGKWQIIAGSGHRL